VGNHRAKSVSRGTPRRLPRHEDAAAARAVEGAGAKSGADAGLPVRCGRLWIKGFPCLARRRARVVLALTRDVPDETREGRGAEAFDPVSVLPRKSITITSQVPRTRGATFDGLDDRRQTHRGKHAEQDMYVVRGIAHVVRGIAHGQCVHRMQACARMHHGGKPGVVPRFEGWSPIACRPDDVQKDRGARVPLHRNPYRDIDASDVCTSGSPGVRPGLGCATKAHDRGFKSLRGIRQSSQPKGLRSSSSVTARDPWETCEARARSRPSEDCVGSNGGTVSGCNVSEFDSAGCIGEPAQVWRTSNLPGLIRDELEPTAGARRT